MSVDTNFGVCVTVLDPCSYSWLGTTWHLYCLPDSSFVGDNDHSETNGLKYLFFFLDFSFLSVLTSVHKVSNMFNFLFMPVTF